MAPVCGSCLTGPQPGTDGEVATRVGVALTEAGSAGSQCWHVCPWLPLQVAQETTTSRAESAPSSCIHPQPPSNSSPFMALWVVPSRQLGLGGRSLTIGPAVLHHTQVHPLKPGWLPAIHLCPGLVLLSTLPHGPDVHFWQDPSSWVSQGARGPRAQQAGPAPGQMFRGGSPNTRVHPLNPQLFQGHRKPGPPLTAALQMVKGGHSENLWQGKEGTHG